MNDADQTYWAHILNLDSDEWLNACQNLEAAGSKALPAILRGYELENPRVRRFCVSLLDHLADSSTVECLLTALDDPDSGVRRLAVHSVGCQSCKIEPLDVDVVDLLITRAKYDKSIRVRRAAIHQLGCQAPDLRIGHVLTEIKEHSKDSKSINIANWAHSHRCPIQRWRST